MAGRPFASTAAQPIQGGTISSSAVWRKSPLVAEVAGDQEDRVALLHLGADQPVVLEGPAARIWFFLDGKTAQAVILEQLALYYGESVDVIAAHTSAFLDSLADQSLVELVPPSAT